MIDATQKFINQEIAEGQGLLHNPLSIDQVEHGLRNIRISVCRRILDLLRLVLQEELLVT